MTFSYKPGNKLQIQVSHFTCTVPEINMTNKSFKLSLLTIRCENRHLSILLDPFYARAGNMLAVWLASVNP